MDASCFGEHFIRCLLETKVILLTNENKSRAGYNTLKLLYSCTACASEYNITGSYISILWDKLLNNGEGPEAGSEQEVAFEEAKRV